MKILIEFENSGLAPLLAEWREYDVATGRQVTVHLPDSQVSGVGQGIDDNGALVVKSNNTTHRFLSGEVSLQLCQ